MRVLEERQGISMTANIPLSSGNTKSGVHLISLATAVPDHSLDQAEVLDRAKTHFFGEYPEFGRLASVFTNAGIERRYSVRPLDWFYNTNGWPDRTQAYREGATELFCRVTAAALAAAGLTARDIHTVVTVSSTGIATPSLEALALVRAGFRNSVQRVPVFGLGCAGGATGLSMAMRLARASPGENVLLVVVELCTLAFRGDELTKSNVIATALFGDGAAAAVVSARDSAALAELHEAGEYTWPGTLDVMGWKIDPIGFSAIFDSSIPDLVLNRLRSAVDDFLWRHDLDTCSIGGFVFHPGGSKVIAALETAFELCEGTLKTERSVLRDFGNMSAPTVLFVLRRALDADFAGYGLLAALGPGFTASFVTFSR